MTKWGIVLNALEYYVHLCGVKWLHSRRDAGLIWSWVSRHPQLVESENAVSLQLTIRPSSVIINVNILRKQESQNTSDRQISLRWGSERDRPQAQPERTLFGWIGDSPSPTKELSKTAKSRENKNRRALTSDERFSRTPSDAGSYGPTLRHDERKVRVKIKDESIDKNREEVI